MHAFRTVPKTGVIFVTSEARKLGFALNDPEWCNLGQGQPETGELPDAPPRVHAVTIAPDDQHHTTIAEAERRARELLRLDVETIERRLREHRARALEEHLVS